MLNKNFVITTILILTILVSGCTAKKKEPKPEEFLTLADLSGRVSLKEDSPGVRVIRIKSKAFIKRNDIRAAKAKAMEIMVTGRKFSFEEAKDMDLVHDIYDSMSLDEFRQDVLDYSGRFTLPFAAAKAIGNIKRSVQSGLEIPLEYHLALERELQSDLFQSEDAKEGIKAYVDKQTPRFEGK